MRRLLATAAITTFALFSTACGSDDKKSDTTEADEPAGAPDDEEAEDAEDADEESGDDEATDDTEAEADDDEATEETEADDEESDPVEDLTEECVAVQDRFDSLDFTDAESFTVIAREMDDFKRFTPDDVDEDIDILIEAYNGMSAVLAENGGDLTNPEVMAKLEEIGTQEVQDASARLETFFNAACPGVGES